MGREKTVAIKLPSWEREANPAVLRETKDGKQEDKKLYTS